MLAAPRYEEFAYERRVPEQELLHTTLVENLETFLDRAKTEEHELPPHVEKELREYVDCGVLGNGFVRLKCDDCGKERVVAFSCKGRGFCPSCTGRRMADTSARLVDDVFPPNAPVRQWVLSLPMQIRYAMAWKLLPKRCNAGRRADRGHLSAFADYGGMNEGRSCGSMYCEV